jgi:hypothetical protein
MDQAPCGEWTIETLHEHIRVLIAASDKRYEQRFECFEHNIELRFTEQKSATAAALAAADRAVQKAETAAEKRFESVNEFRNTLGDQQRNLMPRSEVDVLVKGLESKVEGLKEQVNQIHDERRGVVGGWGYAVGVIGFVLTLANIIGVAIMATK